MTVKDLINIIEKEKIPMDTQVILTGTNDVEDVIGTYVYNGIELHLVAIGSNQFILLKGGE